MDKKDLLSAIQNSGGSIHAEESADPLLAKLNLLEKTGRYKKLLKALLGTNERNNFLAFSLEAVIAYQFEVAGQSLEYEVKQDTNANSSIDFAKTSGTGDKLFIEARLLQEDEATRKEMKAQLEATDTYGIKFTGRDELDKIKRLQRVILSKIQKRDGTPTKFFNVQAGNIDLVAIEVSEIMLGMADELDCILACGGDPAVSAECRRGVVGIFQAVAASDPAWMQEDAKSFGHAHATLHGVLFLFKRPGNWILDYELDHFLAWNCRLIDAARAKAIQDEIAKAIPRKTK